MTRNKGCERSNFLPTRLLYWPKYDEEQGGRRDRRHHFSKDHFTTQSSSLCLPRFEDQSRDLRQLHECNERSNGLDGNRFHDQSHGPIDPSVIFRALPHE